MTLTSVLSHLIALALGAIAGGFVMKNNYAKSVAFLEELKQHAEEGTAVAQAAIINKLKQLL